MIQQQQNIRNFAWDNKHSLLLLFYRGGWGRRDFSNVKNVKKIMEKSNSVERSELTLGRLTCHGSHGSHKEQFWAGCEMKNFPLPNFFFVFSSPLRSYSIKINCFQLNKSRIKIAYVSDALIYLLTFITLWTLVTVRESIAEKCEIWGVGRHVTNFILSICETRLGAARERVYETFAIEWQEKKGSQEKQQNLKGKSKWIV